jgi:hypothetical protein
MCQQGIPFQVSPARTQTVNELKQRKSDVIIFFPGNIKDNKLKKQVKRTINTKGMSNKEIRIRIKEINPNIVICYTVEDTKICYPLPYIMRNTDFYYYNLEIYVPAIIKESDNISYKFLSWFSYITNKLREIVYVKKCRSIVIQDQLRRKILSKYWISHPVTWQIPNSYYKENYEYDVPHKKGLIYSGSVGNDVLGTFLEHASDVKDIEITISGWNYPASKLKENSNIKFFKQNLTQEEYTKFISAYDIALIWYSDNSDENVYNIGLASGKFFKHLSLRQPVIVNKAPGLADEVRKYKLGVVIDDLGELEEAVKMITSKYDYYVQNIKCRYEEKYDYHKAAKSFFDDIVSNTGRKH